MNEQTESKTWWAHNITAGLDLELEFLAFPLVYIFLLPVSILFPNQEKHQQIQMQDPCVRFRGPWNSRNYQQNVVYLCVLFWKNILKAKRLKHTANNLDCGRKWCNIYGWSFFSSPPITSFDVNFFELFSFIGAPKNKDVIWAIYLATFRIQNSDNF